MNSAAPFARTALSACVALAALTAGAAHAGATRQGAPLIVSGCATGEQCRLSAVAANASGQFVVAWEAALKDGVGFDVYGQRFEPSGKPAGERFRVHAWTTGEQEFPSVAMAADGSFVVAWMSEGQDGDGSGVFARTFDAAGDPTRPEFRVSDSPRGVQEYPAVAMSAEGRFAIAWVSDERLFAKRYYADAMPEGDATAVTGGRVRGEVPEVVMGADGRFVVTWTGEDGSASGVFARAFDGRGRSLGNAVRANTTTQAEQRAQSIALAADGRFVVMWESLTGASGANASAGLFGRRFDARGNAVGAEFRIETIPSDPHDVVAGISADGQMLALWNAGAGIAAQRFAADGKRVGGEFIAAPRAAYAAVAALPNAEFMVSYQSNSSDDLESIRAQRLRLDDDGGPPMIDFVGSGGTVAAGEPLELRVLLSKPATQPIPLWFSAVGSDPEAAESWKLPPRPATLPAGEKEAALGAIEAVAVVPAPAADGATPPAPAARADSVTLQLIPPEDGSGSVGPAGRVVVRVKPAQ